MDNKFILGHIFIAVGKQLCDNESELYNSIVLSNEQMEACLKLLKVASSPQTHYVHISGLAQRYGKSERTIRNWIRDGLIPKGRMHEYGDNREYWLNHDLHDIDDNLVKKGCVKKNEIVPIMERLRVLLKDYM